MAWRAPGYYEAAEIASSRGDFATAGDLVDRALEANALNLRALTLKAAVLRNQGRVSEAAQVLRNARRLTDPLDAGLMAEQWLVTRNPADARPFTSILNAFPATASEVAAAYGNAGLWKDGAAVLSQAVAAAPDKSKIPPMTYYYLAHFAGKLGPASKASEYYSLAQRMPPDYVFPFQYEAIGVLRRAIEANPRDARACYYLGNLLYDWQPAEATKYWEMSAALDPTFAIVHRNLAIAYEHDGSPPEKAVAALEKAVSLDRKYPLHFAELDELYEAAAAAPEKRLALLEKNQDIVTKRDDSLAREISLKVTMGQYDEAIKLMTGRRFAVWEGANLDVAEDWANAHLLRGRQRLSGGQVREALTDFQTSTVIPDNLPAAGRGGSDHSTETAYWIGVAYEGLSDPARAKEFWTKAAAAGEVRTGRGSGGVVSAVQTYYRALALRKLGRAAEATGMFQDLVRSAERALQSSDADTVPGNPRQSRQSRMMMGHYAAALGHMGLGETSRTREELGRALAINPAHVGVRSAMASVDRP